MKKAVIFTMFLAVATTAFLVGRKTAASKQVPTASKRILYYVDPMHPGYRADRPGTAPDCGMALVPVFDNSASAGVRVGLDMQRLAGVEVADVERTPGTTTLGLYGRVAPDETRIY